MSWFSGKVSLGNFPDLAGAVNKISESVKNIEKNFDTALGFEEKPAASITEGSWSSAADRRGPFEPVMSFMGHKGEDSPGELEKSDSSSPPSSSKEKEGDKVQDPSPVLEQTTAAEPNEEKLNLQSDTSEGPQNSAHYSETETDSEASPINLSEPTLALVNKPDSLESKMCSPTDVEARSVTPFNHVEVSSLVPNEPRGDADDLQKATDEFNKQQEKTVEKIPPVQVEDVSNVIKSESGMEAYGSQSATCNETESVVDSSLPMLENLDESSKMHTKQGLDEDSTVSQTPVVNQRSIGNEDEMKEQRLSSLSNSSDVTDSVMELEKLKAEMKMMETALQGAARQAQVKADEIAKLMNENEQLKATVEDLRRKSNEAEAESLREEYHQRASALERKIYALTKERDALRREQSKKIDAAALLKEKDEIITQVMAEGEELSKKQAAQESQIRKLRAQIREFEEEKKGLITKLQVEENKVESIKKDKTATEKLLQETIEKHQTELATQKEYYTNALNAAKEAEALAEARANNEARTELESRLREAEEREALLVQALEELRQNLSRKEQQAVFREDMLRKDIEDLQRRYQASERRCEELVTQVPESTRPLLRQIEAMQETNARKAEAWAAVERSLNSRLQEAEAKAATSEERERSVNERLSQTLSRINVLEAQISCLRAEQTQLSRSLEKERQKAAENRQEYLALKEKSDTHEGHVNQLEEEIMELKRKHKQELQEAVTYRELLQQDLEREKATRLELERTSHLQSSAVSDQSPRIKNKPAFENGTLSRKLSSASSLSSMEESFYLQASLDSSDSLSERRNPGDTSISPYFFKSMTPGAFEAALRQKEGELASYLSRLASLESIRDSLAEELVKMTAQCEKLRAEASMLPGIRAELEALRRRHSAALELMGERDEELEELRADIVDLKEMYREQVNLLVNKIQVLSSSIGAG